MNTFNLPSDLNRKFPLTEQLKQFINQSRETVQNILVSKDSRFLVIVGPCSIHDTKGALEFAKLLKRLQESCPSLFLVMRTYFEKARTSYGWKGLFYDPYINGSNQIPCGLSLGRELLIKLAELEVPAACELLDPLMHCYIEDLITWSCIGARTSSSQVHRQIASGLKMPVGLKNTTDGNIETAVYGVLSANQGHAFLNMNKDGKVCIQNTSGNPFAHVVLRGGENGPNYHREAISEASEMLRQMRLSDSLIVDCSHDNSRKNHRLQTEVFNSVLSQVLDGNQAIKGAMLESYLFAGNQHIENDLKYGISITDACLSWEDTESLLLKAQQILQENEAASSLKCATV